MYKIKGQNTCGFYFAECCAKATDKDAKRLIGLSFKELMKSMAFANRVFSFLCHSKKKYKKIRNIDIQLKQVLVDAAYR